MPSLKNRQERTFTFWIGDKIPQGGSIPKGSMIAVLPGEVTRVTDEEFEKLQEIPLFKECIEKEQITIVGATEKTPDAKDLEIAELKERLRQAAISRKAAAEAREAEKAAAEVEKTSKKGYGRK
jgi:hypothetical protein